MKTVGLIFLLASFAGAATNDVDLYTAQDLNRMADQLLQKRTQFSSEDLKHYGNDHTMMAHREATGASEVHEKEADFFYAVSGDAELVSGGKLTNPKTIKPGELRGTGIEGGTKQAFPQGSIVHIPAGVPHQLIIPKGKQFTYFVVKVTE